MKIEVSVERGAAAKEKGDLLEKITGYLLSAQNYIVEDQIQKTGFEFDVVCRGKVNQKKIYVQCKAYKESDKIQAQDIKDLIAARELHKYDEVWLISTSDLGKQAKGMVDDLDQKIFSIYRPSNVVDALVSASVIVAPEVVKAKILEITKDKNKIGDVILLVTPYGNYWLTEFKQAGEVSGIFANSAIDGALITDRKLLIKLKKLDSSFGDSDFQAVFKVTEKEIRKSEEIFSTDLKLDIAYLKKLNNLGVKFTNPYKDELALDDIFVFPDLQDAKKEDAEKINSKSLLGKLYEKNLILGEDMSGKTSLAYSLQIALNKKGLIPIFVEADEIRKGDRTRVEALLVTKFHKQYSDQDVFIDAFKRILSNEKDKIILIVDNLENLNIKKEILQAEFYKNSSMICGQIFLFANSSMEIEILAKPSSREMFSDFQIFRIKQFGHVLRDDLIAKWLLAGNDDDMSDGEMIAKKDEISNRIRVLVGANFVPTYPLYLLTMLQAIEANTKNKLHGSSYAELYRYLINQSLMVAGIRGDDLDFYHTYLSHLAFSFFISGNKKISEEDLGDMYEEYCQKMDIEKSFSSVHELFLRAKILKKEKDCYSFNYQYTYYFFVAKYFADNFRDKEVKKHFQIISERLYKSEFANIVVFLVHHSKDTSIINKVIKEAQKLFESTDPFRLTDKELLKINNLVESEVKFLLEDGDLNTNRKKYLEEKDKIEEGGSPKAEEYDEKKVLDLIGKINLSFKIMEILGQITINYYGSLDSKKKISIFKEINDLGFKSLHALIDDFEKNADTLRLGIEKLIEEKKPSLKQDKEKIAKKFIFNFIGGLITVFLKQASDCVASRNLFPSINKMVEPESPPSIKLVRIAAKLNFPNELKIEEIIRLDKEFSNNYLAKSLLRYLVVEHLYKFDVKYSDKQSICDHLGIDLAKNKGIQNKKGS